MRTRQRESDETTRLAVEMHTRDQEALHQRLATEAALQEAQVPPEYLQRAQEQIRMRQVGRQQRWQVLAILLAAMVPVAGAIAFAISRTPSKPINDSFTAAAYQRWSLDVNEGSKASVDFNQGRATIKVDRFAKGEDGRYWATLRSINGDLNLRTLKTLSFSARGEGLSHVRFRFVRGNRSWVTPSYEVRPGWQAFSVPLNQLNEFKVKGDSETSDGSYDDRPRSSVSEMQIQTGSHVNPADASGKVEIDDISIR